MKKKKTSLKIEKLKKQNVINCACGRHAVNRIHSKACGITLKLYKCDICTIVYEERRK